MEHFTSFDSEPAKAIKNSETDRDTTIQPHGDPSMHVFVPNRLHLAEHPEIDVLPLNVLFARSTPQNDNLITGAALYNPDLSSLALERKRIALTYRNTLDSSWVVFLQYNWGTQSWTGTKSARSKVLFYSFGNTWEGFFKHFTLSGLHDVEPCAFFDLP